MDVVRCSEKVPMALGQVVTSLPPRPRYHSVAICYVREPIKRFSVTFWNGKGKADETVFLSKFNGAEK